VPSGPVTVTLMALDDAVDDEGGQGRPDHAARQEPSGKGNGGRGAWAARPW